MVILTRHISSTAASLLEKALKLKPEERHKLAENLWISLQPVDPALEAYWEKEISARVASIRSSSAELIDEDEVYARLDEN